MRLPGPCGQSAAGGGGGKKRWVGYKKANSMVFCGDPALSLPSPLGGECIVQGVDNKQF